ncbi:MAG: phosphate ABC transporter permease subunit PstC [Firmicutes bacterium]|nr:phosphate ABC transporter permease subunit PstC [Bacillota bacterium]
MSRMRHSVLWYDRFFRHVFVASAAVVGLIILAVIFFVARQGLLTFTAVSPWEFLFTTNWNPPGNYGAFTFIFGSFAVTVLAVCLGGPLGLAGAVFLAKVAPEWVRESLRPATDLFVGIPSVVYGWIGLTVFVPLVREHLGGTGFGLLVAGIILGIMILPTVISVSEDSLRAVPPALEEASYGLGATRWQTLSRVVLPAAAPGLVTAVILGMARAIGEAMAVQMVIGNSPQFPRSLVTPTATLTSEIVLEMGNTPFGSTWNNALFFMAFTLLVLSLAMILLIRLVVRHRGVTP